CEMSALCQKQTHAVQQFGATPFGLAQQRRGYRGCREGSLDSAAERCPSLRTNWRIGPIVLTMAAPAGLVMKPCSGSRTPAPDSSLASASRYGFPGSSPVTAASNTCTSPWSDSET